MSASLSSSVPTSKKEHSCKKNPVSHREQRTPICRFNWTCFCARRINCIKKNKRKTLEPTSVMGRFHSLLSELFLVKQNSCSDFREIYADCKNKISEKIVFVKRPRIRGNCNVTHYQTTKAFLSANKPFNLVVNSDFFIRHRNDVKWPKYTAVWYPSTYAAHQQKSREAVQLQGLIQ